MTFHLAMVQMLVRGGEKEENLKRAEERIAQAAADGADIVLLPETLDLGWTHPSSKAQAEPIPDGEPCQRLSAAAARAEIFVCAGLTEKSGDQVFNAAVLIDRRGEIILKHRKINELEIGHAFYALGDRLNVARTELGTIGLMICADAFAPGLALSRSLCHMGAQTILSPCAWAIDSSHDNMIEPYGGLWKDSYGPIAREFGVWFAGASNVGPIDAGPWAGRRCIGCSLVVGPAGETALEGPYGAEADTILHIDIEPRERPRSC